MKKEQKRIHNKINRQILTITLLLLMTFGQAMAGNSLREQAGNFLNSLGGQGKTDSSQNQGTSTGFSLDDITQGLKEALAIGSRNVVKQLGTIDGFNADPRIHIPLPENLVRAQSLLKKVGLSSLADDLETRMNRAAESAAAQAQGLFTRAISDMSFEDAKAILQGEDNAATLYFKEKMTPDLRRAMKPIVDKTLAEVQALQIYDSIKARYQNLPFAPDITADISRHVVDKGMDGIFYYMAQEEKAIRKDPVKRTTALLKKIFQ